MVTVNPLVPMDERWKIICPSYSGAIGVGAGIVNEAISTDVHYTVEMLKKVPSDRSHLVIIGTPEDALIGSLLKEMPKKDGYVIDVGDSPFFPGKKLVLLAGYSPVETLYAAAEFADDYKSLCAKESGRNAHFDVFAREFFPDYYSNTAPFLKRRGIWTWGHVIYDYRRFLTNMARLKLNRITIWNDYVPVNMQAVIDFAHSLGISVILGFSWGWYTDVTKIEFDRFDEWKQKIVNDYKCNYANLNHDGIYFQTFTETSDEQIRGTSIAETAVKWVNAISAELLELYPGLEIQFGLHATSVKNHLDVIAQVDKRVSIIWEDCGDFPWHYMAYADDTQEETENFTKQIALLRRGAPFGGVLKGQVTLDWLDFEHQTGPYIMGETPQKMNIRRDYALRTIKQNQSWWLKNIDRLRQTITIMGSDADIENLFEDGLLEENIWFTAALFAQLAWDTKRDTADVIQLVAARENVKFA